MIRQTLWLAALALAALALCSVGVAADGPLPDQPRPLRRVAGARPASPPVVLSTKRSPLARAAAPQDQAEWAAQALPLMVEAGRPVTYTYTVTNTLDVPRTYVLTDTLPADLRVQPSSVQNAVYDVASHTVRARFSLPAAQTLFDFVAAEPGQPNARPFIDLAGLGVPPLPQGENGDEVGVVYDLAPGLPPFPFLGQSYRSFGLVGNGYLVPGGLQDVSDILYQNTRLPKAGRPHPMLAPFWSDLDLSAGPTGHGEWYADVVTGGAFEDQHALVVQWREVERYQQPGSRFTFEAILVLETGEISYVYGPLNGPLTPVTMGIENADGSQGKTWFFNGGPAERAPHAGQTLTFIRRGIVASPQPYVVTYRARPMAVGVLTNTVVLARDGDSAPLRATVAVTATGPAPQTRTLTADSERVGYARPLLPRDVLMGETVLAGVEPARGLVYYGLFQTPPLDVPDNAQIIRAWLELTGKEGRYLDPRAAGLWRLRLLASSFDPLAPSLTWGAVAQAPVAATIGAPLGVGDVGVGRVNTFAFNQAQLPLLAARRGQRLTFRVDGETTGAWRAIFGWDDGRGPAARPPSLSVEFMPPIVELP